jgi:RNA polymerase sigma factor (sigma-70 family)
MNMTTPVIEQLFHHHWQELTRAIRRIVRCEQAAADLAQETYLRFLNMGRSVSVSFPRALLFRTAQNLAIDHLRRGKFEPQGGGTDDLFRDLPSGAPSPERVLSDKQRVRLLLHAIESLPPRCKEAFLLHRVLACYPV